MVNQESETGMAQLKIGANPIILKQQPWTRRGIDGKFMDRKADGKPFKGLRTKI